jgi:hypothetical protein
MTPPHHSLKLVRLPVPPLPHSLVILNSAQLRRREGAGINFHYPRPPPLILWLDYGETRVHGFIVPSTRDISTRGDKGDNLAGADKMPEL